MKYEALSIDAIANALSFLDPNSTRDWLVSAMAIKHELGMAGMGIWLEWASNYHKFNQKESIRVFKKTPVGKVTIGTLIFMAKDKGFVFSETRQELPEYVKAERAHNRMIAEEQSAVEEAKREKRQAYKAEEASKIYNSLPEAPADHPYLVRKQIFGYGARVGSWVYKNENEELVTENNCLIIPLFDKDGIKSLQAIFEDGTKKILAGAKKEGSYFVIGEPTDTVIICEGFATGATLHESSMLQVFVAIDAGNLIKVAKAVREMMPLAKIIIAADNDQYNRFNTGLKAAQEACCEIDADIIYPVFKDTSSQPTDFNDLFIQEGFTPVANAIAMHERMYRPVMNNAEVHKTFDLAWIENPEKVFNESGSPLEVARAAYWYALQLANEVPAFRNTESIRKEMEAHVHNGILSPYTVLNIMKRVQWSIFNRKRIAMTAIKPDAWNKRHNHIVVSNLEEFKPITPVTLVIAPMGAGKTKHVIKPFCEDSESFVAIAHRRSLIADLSSNLGITSYEKMQNPDSIAALNKLAICLPSTQSFAFKPFMSMVRDIAIDEISQNIRFTSSRECKVAGANEETVFFGLKQLVSEAGTIVACDASIDQMTLDFFEMSRFGRSKFRQRRDFLNVSWEEIENEPEVELEEVFTIVEQAPRNNSRRAFIYNELEDILAKVRMELDNGGNVWMAVESAEKAEILSQLLGENIPHLMITSRNSKKKEIREFLANIEDESRKYRLVIASPAISSGVSVEHHGNPHFTMIAGMASGHSICFSDFAQMLGRVRYVSDYHIFLQKNNKRLQDGITANSILYGQRQAASIEGASLRENEYSSFKARIEANEEMYRADFANGLAWFLEYFCFKVERGYVSEPDFVLSERMKEIAKESKQVHRMKIKSAKKITHAQAESLKELRSLTEEQEYSLLAFRLRNSFKFDVYHEISEQDIDMFENLRTVDRFARFLGYSTANDDSLLNIGLRKFEKAQIHGAKIIFDGVDLSNMTQKTCDEMIARISKNENRFMLSALKLIPSQYGKWNEDKQGKLKEYPLPTRSGKAVAAILGKFGLQWKRHSGGRGEEQYYAVTPESLSVMKYYAENRYKALD